MRFDIVTIFPDFFRGPLDYGIVRRAREAGLIDIRIHDLRTFTHDRHKTVDDRPFGGGEGMVLKPEPIFECIESTELAPREQRVSGEANETMISLSAQGKMFGQPMAQELARLDRVVLLCGRYEGVDERVSEHLADREVSVGDFVLSGGELGAAVIVDAVTRLLPGALGNAASAWTESFSTAQAEPVFEPDGKLAPASTIASGGLLDFPHFTRPAAFRGMLVPVILLYGIHDE